MNPGTVAKDIFEALKDIVTDVNMRFDADGLRIVAMNQSQTLLVHLRLDADKLEKYACAHEHVVGINIPRLHKNVRSVQGGDAVKFTSLIGANGLLLFRVHIHCPSRNRMRACMRLTVPSRNCT